MFKKEKKFIASILAVFLVFVLIGKYSQSQALTSASVVYATTVKDKDTGETVRFEVRRLKDSTFKITNVNTGEEYISKPQTIAENYLRFKVGDKDHPVATFDLKKGLVPWDAPSLTLNDSSKYKKTSKPSQTYSVGDSSQKNNTSKKSDSSSKHSGSSTSDSSAKQEPSKIDLTSSDIENLNFEFGQWLSESKYGKDSVVVNGMVDEIDHIAGATTSFLYQNTVDGEILTRVIGWLSGELSKSPSYNVKGQSVDYTEFMKYRDSFKIAVLGTDMTSENGEDYQAKSAFRVYTLKDKRASGVMTLEEEYKKLVDPVVPAEQNIGAGDYGYRYYYQNEVDGDQPSYQIILADNGNVYYVKNYWQTTDITTYELAPKDMQEKYQQLLKKYARKSENSSSEKQKETESSSSQSSSAEGVFPEELIGTWEHKEAGGFHYIMTFEKDGTVTKVTSYEGSSFTTEQGHVSSIAPISDGLYRYVEVDKWGAVSPGQYGGVGVKYASGFKIDSKNSMTAMVWQTAENADFDFSKPLGGGISFEKVS